MVVEHGAGGRQVRVASLPLGVPFERFGSLAEVAPPATIDKPREAQVTRIIIKYRWQLLDVLNLAIINNEFKNCCAFKFSQNKIYLFMTHGLKCCVLRSV